MNKILFYISFVLVFFSCEKDQTTFTSNFVSAYGIENYEQALKELKNYALFGVFTEGVSKLYLKKPGWNGDEYYGEIFTIFRPIDESVSNVGEFLVGDFKSKFDLDYGNYMLESDLRLDPSALGDHLASEYFGRDIQFSLVRDGQSVYNETLYIPKAIDAEFDQSEPVELTTFISVDKNHLSVRWNPDEHNENGVLIVSYYHGDSLEGPNIGGGEFKVKAFWAEDDGHANITHEYFDQFPENAIVRFEINRAHFKIIEGQDGWNYKIYGLTTDVITCVL